MPRRNRIDYPGAWHHVMNRGIARRVLFENRACMRQFLCYLALAVRRGQIRVHSYCLLPNHFHILVTSPKGQLSRGMQRILNGYSRWFNRRCRRDGALYRARYLSKLVESATYRRILVAYIDNNPVAAGIVDDPVNYPYGSARAWGTGRLPPWLAREWILGELGLSPAGMRTDRHVPGSLCDSYRLAFAAAQPQDLQEIVERRSLRHEHGDDALDDLAAAAPDRVRAWMLRKARLADGTVPCQPMVGTAAVGRVLDHGRRRQSQWLVRVGQRCVDGWQLLQVMMLRDLCALSFPEIGRRLGVTDQTARRQYLRHRQLFQQDPCYQSTALEATAAVLRRCHPPSRVVKM